MNERTSTDNRAPYPYDFEKEVTKRLKRIETRLVSGFEAQGVPMTNHASGIDVDHERGVINIASLGTTVGMLLDATQGHKQSYYVMYNGKAKCIFSTK